MIHFAIALIVVAFVAADFGSDMWLDGQKSLGWDWGLTLVLAFAAVWFWKHRADD